MPIACRENRSFRVKCPLSNVAQIFGELDTFSEAIAKSSVFSTSGYITRSPRFFSFSGGEVVVAASLAVGQ
uniref:Uncharacterized protein n=1 Tax=Desertifilum tharense IPPAS B-1220 TaxID=1781255 RepID=A0ACD5GT38_9CYAN